MDPHVLLVTVNRKLREFLAPFLSAHRIEVSAPEATSHSAALISVPSGVNLVVAINSEHDPPLVDLGSASRQQYGYLHLTMLPWRATDGRRFRFLFGTETLDTAQLLERIRERLGLEAVGSGRPALQLSDLLGQIMALYGTGVLVSDRFRPVRYLAAQKYVSSFGRRLGLSPADLESLCLASLLYDLGMLLVPETVALKAGALTRKEKDTVGRHPEDGSVLARKLGLPGKVLDIIRCHHERMDGKGYPNGITGREIPLEARVLSVVDGYLAMTENRPYRKALPRNNALVEIMRGSGSVYDGQVVRAFVLDKTKPGNSALRHDEAEPDEIPVARFLSPEVAVALGDLWKPLLGGTGPDGRPARRGLAGALADVRLDALCQMLKHGLKTARLRIRSSHGPAEVYFRCGEVVHAQFRSLKGEKAFYTILALRSGSFDIEFESPAPMTTVSASLEHLLLEGYRLLDEARRRRREESPGTDRPARAPATAVPAARSPRHASFGGGARTVEH